MPQPPPIVMRSAGSLHASLFGLALAALIAAQGGALPGMPSPDSAAARAPGGAVRLGLLVPKNDAGQAARHGAELAVDQANAAGGFRGRPFELVVRSDEGPWGSGSKEIARLVFEDSVWAVLGGLDGRGAHLAEQIVTKARLVLVSPWATDPTLTQINIPWFFRCVPDDRRQAEALAHAIAETSRISTVAVVAEATYDARYGASAFAHAAAARGLPPVHLLTVEPTDDAIPDVLTRLEGRAADGIVFYGAADRAAHLVRQMQARGMTQTVFGPLSLGEAVLLRAVGRRPDAVRIVMPGHWDAARSRGFRQAFQARYGYPPPPLAAYAYDGTAALIDAVRRGGLDRDRIREALATLTYPQGATGPIRFDARGNRLGPVTVVDVGRDRPAFLNEAPSPTDSQ